MKKRIIAFLLSISMLVAAVPVTTISSAAADKLTTITAPDIFKTNEDGKLILAPNIVAAPEDNLTILDAAAILVGVLRPTAKIENKNAIGLSDKTKGIFERVVGMGIFSATAKTNVNARLSLKGAYTVLDRVFKFTEEQKGLANSVSPEVLKGGITVAEFIAAVDVFAGTILNGKGTYTANSFDTDNVTITKSGITLENATIEGKLTIADGVGNGDVTIKDVTVKGNIVARGCGKNTFKMLGSSSTKELIASNMNHAFRVFAESAQAIMDMIIASGHNGVTVDAACENITSYTTSPVLVAQNAKNVLAAVKDADITIGAKATIGVLSSAAAAIGATLTVQGAVDALNAAAPDTGIKALNGAKLGLVTTETTATGTTVSAAKGSEVKELKANAANTAVTGSGNVISATINGNNVSIGTGSTKVIVAAGVKDTTVGNNPVNGGTNIVSPVAPTAPDDLPTGEITTQGDGTTAPAVTTPAATTTVTTANPVAPPSPDVTTPITANLESIEVKTPPTKTAYAVGDTLDVTGLVMLEKYDDGSTCEVPPLTNTAHRGYTFDVTTITADKTTVTVTYNGKTTTFNITITAGTPITVAATGISTKTGAVTVTLSQAIEGLMATDIVIKKGNDVVPAENYTLGELSAPTFTVTFNEAASLDNTSVITINITKTGYSFNGGSAVTVENTIPATEISAAAITGLALPATGATPVALAALATTQTTEFDITSIAWADAEGTVPTKFAANTAYTATIVLTAKPTHKFTEVTPTTGGVGTPAKGTLNADASTLTFVVTFAVTAKATVTNTALKITKPETGAIPTLKILDEQYTGTITYAPVVTDKFATEIAYKAIITLNPTSNYTFAEGTVFTVVGATVATVIANGTATVTATFAKTTGAVSALTTAKNTAKAEVDAMLPGSPTTYTPASWNNLLVAIEADKTAIDALTTEEACTTFAAPKTTAAKAALVTLVKELDDAKAAAKKTLTDLKPTDAALYTTESIAVLEAAITADTTTINNCTTIADLKTAIKTLTAKASMLELIADLNALKASKTAELNNVVPAADKDLYTATSYATYKIALDAAIKSVTDAKTLAEVSAITIAPLTTAKANLVKLVQTLAVPGIVNPVEGAMSYNASTASGEYDITIVWKNAAGVELAAGAKFGADTYTATITLKAKAGFSFDGIAANAFSVNGINGTSAVGTDTVTVTVEFALNTKPVTDTVINITAPRANKAPETSVTSTSTQYTSKITWKGADNSVPNTFANGIVYTATVTLTATDGYSFAGMAASEFSVNGTHVIGSETGTKDAITFTFKFPPAVVITMNTNLLLFMLPVAGRSWFYEGGSGNNYYSYDSIIKDPSEHVLSDNEIYKPSTEYTAVFELTAMGETSFIGMEATDFTVNGNKVTKAGKVTAKKMIIEYILPKTEAQDAPIEKVKAGELHLNMPESGKTANCYMYTSQMYEYRVTYRDEKDVLIARPAAFKTSTVYKATISLTARPGYTFKDVKANEFTVKGATVTDNAVGTADGLTISYVCPTTALTIEYEPITNENLSIIEPVAGGIVNNDLSTPWYYGVNSFVWRDTNDNRIASPAVFEANTTYTATIVLEADEGYKFTTNSFTINKETVTPKLTNGDRVATIKTKAFATGDGAVVTPTKVTETNLNVGDLIVGESATYHGNSQLSADLCLTTRNGKISDNKPTNTETLYTVKIRLTAKPGFTLRGMKANNFTVNGTQIVGETIGTDKEIIISYDTNAKVSGGSAKLIQVIERNVNIKVPMAGKLIVTDIDYPDGFRYSYTFKRIAQEKSFEENSSYEVTCELIARSGYTFEGIDLSAFRINYNLVPKAERKGDNVILTYTFNTGNIVIEKVTSTNLFINFPVAGKHADNNVQYYEYYNTVTWEDNQSNVLTSSDVFKVGETYTATAVLTAYPAYTFTGMNSKDFTIKGYGVTKLTQPADDGKTITITYTFPPAEEPVLKKLQDTNISIGNIFVGYSINYANLSNDYLTLSKPIWTKDNVALIVENDTKFAEGSTYEATFNASIDEYDKDDYTLTGLTAKDFTVNGHGGNNIALTPKTDGTVDITYTFPKMELIKIEDHLALEILPPVVGRDFETTLTFSRYNHKDGVLWEATDGTITGNALANTVYTATVTLFAYSGYTFTGTDISTFVLNGKKVTDGEIATDGMSVTFSYTFPATASA